VSEAHATGRGTGDAGRGSGIGKGLNAADHAAHAPPPAHTARTEPLRPQTHGGRAVLNVAFDATPLLGHPTGVGQFCAGALRGLAGRDDVELRAFAVSWRRRGLLPPLLPTGVASHQRAMPARPLHLAWAHGEHPAVERFVGPVDVVHGSNFVVPPARTAARVATVHDLTTVRYPELCDAATLRFPELVRRALSRGAFVHTPSAFVAGEVVELLGAPADRVRAVHSGVPALPDPDEDPAVVARRWLPPGTERYVLAIGTAEPRKDLPGLVRAFGHLAAAHPDVALVLAGPAGWGSGPLARAIDASTASDRVVRTGWLDDAKLSALLRAATVLAYPSLYEGFGFPPLQAMAVGVPVVATAAGALPEIVGDGALQVSPGDSEVLAAALAGVLGSSTEAAALADRGRRRAAEFSWARCAAGLADLYADAAAARSTR